MHVAFIDESQRNGRYLLAAVALDEHQLAPARRQLRTTLYPGQRRTHFSSESRARRGQLLAVYRRLTIARVVVYEHRAGVRSVAQRERCLEVLTGELLGAGVGHVRLDHTEAAQQERDRRVIAPLVEGTGTRYDHEPERTTDPLIAVADAVAWCAGRGGEWAQRLRGWAEVRHLP